ncbi:MAG: hypothetical protein ACREBP_08575, partial [Sphingomicrobium sp.]
VHERDGKQSEDHAFTCARYLLIGGWAIVLGLMDGQGGDVETRLPAELEAWATKFAAANAAPKATKNDKEVGAPLGATEKKWWDV